MRDRDAPVQRETQYLLELRLVGEELVYSI